MKHILQLLMLVLVLPGFGVAQTYQPIPDSKAAWIIRQNAPIQGEYFFHKLFLSPTLDDTVINAITYTKLFYRFELHDSEYIGAFRNGDNGKSYYLPEDAQQEYLLRDFTKNTGDTVKNVVYNNNWYDYILVLDFLVDSVNIVNSGPYNYKVMYLSTVIEDTIPGLFDDEPLVWIEKIGTFGGGILNSHRFELSSHPLYCMQYNDTIYFDFHYFDVRDIIYEFGECDYPVGIGEQGLNDIRINVLPNPIENKIILSNLPQNKLMVLSLLNIHGQTVFQKNLVAGYSVQQIDIDDVLPSGLYILKITTGNHVLLTRKIIKK